MPKIEATNRQKFTLKRLSGLVLGIAFTVTAFFGVHLAMNMDSQGVMQNCPLLGYNEKICTMTVTEHMTKWQQLFTATMPSVKSPLTALMLIAFSFLVFVFRFSLINVLHFQITRSNSGPPGYSSGFLLQAFGRGVLRKRE